MIRDESDSIAAGRFSWSMVADSRREGPDCNASLRLEKSEAMLFDPNCDDRCKLPPQAVLEMDGRAGALAVASS